MIRWFEHSQVYAPSTRHETTPEQLGMPVEEVFLSASDGVRLHGWFLPADKNAERSHFVILLLHGNAGNISTRIEFYRAWLGMGVNVFTFDYRGFGRSQGKASEAGTYLDAQAAYQWLQARGFGPHQVIALGKSLGGGIASELALREPLGGLVLQSTFTNIPDVGKELYPWLPVRWLSTIKYDTISKLPRIKVPVLVAHSRGDRVVPFHHAEKNFAAANEPKLFWEIQGSHTGTLEAGRERYLEGLNQFFKLIEAGKTAKG